MTELPNICKNVVVLDGNKTISKMVYDYVNSNLSKYFPIRTCDFDILSSGYFYYNDNYYMAELKAYYIKDVDELGNVCYRPTELYYVQTNLIDKPFYQIELVGLTEMDIENLLFLYATKVKKLWVTNKEDVAY